MADRITELGGRSMTPFFFTSEPKKTFFVGDDPERCAKMLSSNGGPPRTLKDKSLSVELSRIVDGVKWLEREQGECIDEARKHERRALELEDALNSAKQNLEIADGIITELQQKLDESNAGRTAAESELARLREQMRHLARPPSSPSSVAELQESVRQVRDSIMNDDSPWVRRHLREQVDDMA